jgi:hypothetical protein
MCVDELERLRKRFKLKRRRLRIVQDNLYHMLQQYTNGVHQRASRDGHPRHVPRSV